jgi:hypothetical protein
VSRRAVSLSCRAVSYTCAVSWRHGITVSRRAVSLSYRAVSYTCAVSWRHCITVSRRAVSLSYRAVSYTCAVSWRHGVTVSRRAVSLSGRAVSWRHGITVSRRAVSLRRRAVSCCSNRCRRLCLINHALALRPAPSFKLTTSVHRFRIPALTVAPAVVPLFVSRTLVVVPRVWAVA